MSTQRSGREPSPEPQRQPSAYQRALARIHGRSIWWFVAASVALAFVPVSGPVLILLYVVLAIFFWIPLLASTADGFRRGFRGER